jgi:glycosyltransferase involved in cell wall biosynthesis
MTLCKATVIVPMYNRCDDSIRCIESLINQNFSFNEFEVLLIDDGSNDDTEAKVKAKIKNYTNIFYIKNENNLGRVLTRNIGIQKSRGYILIFLDNDMIVNPDFVKAHVEAHSKLGGFKKAVIGNIFYPDYALVKSNFGRYIQSRAVGYRKKDKYLIRNNLQFNIEGKYFAGGNSSCPRDIVIGIGSFDKEFEKYGGEDEYFGYKLTKFGVKIVYEEMAKSLHNDNNVGPEFWSRKYIEYGKYAFSNMLDKPDYLATSSLSLLSPIKKNKFSISQMKSFLVGVILNKIVEKIVLLYVFKTDSNNFFYFPLLYKIAQAIWIKKGLESDKDIQFVNY